MFSLFHCLIMRLTALFSLSVKQACDQLLLGPCWLYGVHDIYKQGSDSSDILKSPLVSLLGTGDHGA